MNGLTEMLLFALYWCLARNLVFTGLGMTEAVETAANPRRILLTTGILAAFSLPATALAWLLAELLSPLAPPELAQLPAALCYIAVSAVFYAGAMLLLGKFRPEWAKKYRPEMTCAAFSVLALGAFLIGRTQGASILQALVLTLACCAAFLAASFLMAPVQRMSWSPRIPKMFRGMPVQLLYAAIITLPLTALGTLAG